MRPEPLPVGWRRQLVDMVRGAAPASSTLFEGRGGRTGAEQVGVYHEQFQLRMLEALHQDLPGLCWMLGDQADAWLLAYLRDRPSRSWTLAHLTEQLLDWAASRLDPAPLDMARLDRAVVELHAAKQGEALDPIGILEGARLQLSPHARLLRLDHDVHRVRTAVLAGDRPSVPAPGAVHLVAWCSADGVRTRALHPVAWTLLDVTRHPRPLSAALETLLTRGVDAEVVGQRIGDWCRVFAERGLWQRAA